MPVLLAVSVIVATIVMCVVGFRVADADIATRPAAPFAAIMVAFFTFLAGTLISSFLTMLAYTVARLGRTQQGRTLQFLGLGLTLVCAVVGVAVAFLIPATL